MLTTHENIEAAQQRAIAIVGGLPHGPYKTHYQPTYLDRGELTGAVQELLETEPITAPEHVQALRAELTGIAEGSIKKPVVITRRCAEPIHTARPVGELVSDALADRQVVIDALGQVVVVQRNRGQYAKPRSAELERVTGNHSVVSYMGDSINGQDIGQRSPRARKMLDGARQARNLEAGLTAAVGHHVYSAHEALLLAYEHAFVREDQGTSRHMLLSTDLPWIGKRTNALQGPHIALLSKVDNPVGIKIGSDSTPEHIAGLQRTLNPEGKPGKLLFMLRIGLHETAQLDDVICSIRDHAPWSLMMYDIHGTTRMTPDGLKIRYVGDIIENIKVTAEACGRAGLRLHGVHLETTSEDRLECVDEPGQLPTHPGGVDPQLNLRQLDHVLRETADYLR